MPIRGKLTKPKVRSTILGLLFASPWIIGFLAFTLYPVAASLYYSFFRFDFVRKPIFIGLENYRDMFFNDEIFRIVMGNTLYLVVLGVPQGYSPPSCWRCCSTIHRGCAALPHAFLPAIVPASPRRKSGGGLQSALA
jgi:hypothetical protein